MFLHHNRSAYPCASTLPIPAWQRIFEIWRPNTQRPLTNDVKFDYLLPPRHPFTAFIVVSTHTQLYHAEVSHTVTSIRQSYWIPVARQMNMSEPCYIAVLHARNMVANPIQRLILLHCLSTGYRIFLLLVWLASILRVPYMSAIILRKQRYIYARLHVLILLY